MDDRRPLILIAALILVGCVEDTSLLPLPSWCEAEPQQVATFQQQRNGLFLDRGRRVVALHVEGLEYGLRQPEGFKSHMV